MTLPGARRNSACQDIKTPLGSKTSRSALEATGTRREFDSMGTVEVPADRYWGAQTARSLVHFSIGDDRMPKAVYHAYGIVKKACALVNQGRRPPGRVEGRRHHPRRRRDHRRKAG